MRSGTFLKSAAAALAVATLAVGSVGAAHAADNIAPYAAPAGWSHDLLFGVSGTSQYISRGLANSSGFAIQPWAEFDYGPLYAGYWGSNVDPAIIGSSWENDLSVGARGMLGPVGWDVGYVRYVYNPSSLDFGEVYAKGSITPIMPLTLGASIFYNPVGQTTYVEANAKVALVDQLSASGAIGSQDGVGSWNAGLTWAPMPWLSLDGRYFAGPAGGGANKFVFTVAFSTSLSALKGGG